MGRWRYSKRDTAGGCKVIDIHFLRKYGLLENSKEGFMKWTLSDGKENSISIKSSVEEEPICISFIYTSTDHEGKEEEFNYNIPLEKTPCNYGSYRYWFKCQGVRNGVYCGKRVSKLYKIPHGKYFLCRHCYNLTYHLRTISRKWTYDSDRIDRKLNKISRKMEKKGVHIKTHKRLSREKNRLTWDLYKARAIESRRLLAKVEKIKIR